MKGDKQERIEHKLRNSAYSMMCLFKKSGLKQIRQPNLYYRIQAYENYLFYV